MPEALQGAPLNEQLTWLFEFARGTLVDGGWVMWPLFGLAIFIYYEAVSLILYLGKAKLKKYPQERWAKWVTNPEEGVGYIGDTIRYTLAQGYDPSHVVSRLDAVRASILPMVNQKIVTLSVLVTISPLMGLLGTVIGMLTTFKGLAAATGQTIDLVASGISVALITTQTGLMIAIPGYIFINEVAKSRNRFKTFFAQLESAAMQECARRREAA